ncbi:MAG: hypothetical protein J6K19_04115 [Prevotella sp.]|nr:hypothetical protein [Prevotella sp.]
MKKSKLLIAGALLLAGNIAQAEIVDGVRQKPVPAKTQLQYGETLYLYNVNAKGFFLGANSYDTRASYGDKGYKVWITKHLEEDGSWDGKSIILKDSIEAGSPKGKILMTWSATIDPNNADDLGSVWVDWANQADTLWTLTPQAADIYRISVGAGNANNNEATYPNTAFGADLTKTSTELWWRLDTSVETNAIDWYFVSPEGYAAYLEAIPAYTASIELKKQLDVAKSKGIDVAAEETIYLNEAATVEEIEAATAAVIKKISEYDEQHVSADQPIDKTELLTNPSYDKNSNEGWSGDTPAFQSYTNAEFYNKTYNYYQAKTDVPNGVYAIDVQAFYRSGNAGPSYEHFVNNTEYRAKIYAKTGEDTVKVSIVNPFSEAATEPVGIGNESSAGDPAVYIPNNMQAAGAYFDLGKYHNKLFFGVDDKTFQIGLEKTSTIDGDWTLFDNWTLKYYGNTPAAFQEWMKQVIADAPDFDNLPEGTLITKGMVDAYKASVAAVAGASDKAAVIAATKAIEEAAALVQANIDAWRKYKEAYNKGLETANNDQLQGPDMDILSDYIYGDAEDFMDDLTLTTEEILAEIENLNTLIDNAVRNCVQPGQDVTNMYLVNADYENGATGWEGNPTIGGPSNNKCAEKFNTAFDVYQVVKDAPIGVYSVSLQGFFRPGDNAVAYPKYLDGTLPKNNTICVYVNNNTDALTNIYDEKVPYGELFQTDVNPAPYEDTDNNVWYVNDMVNAGIAFSNGMYTSKAFGLVAKKGDVLRIGIKGEKDNANQWVCWDSFKMIYEGFNAEIIKPELEKAIEVLKGKQGTLMGASISKQVEDALKAADEAVAGTDGQAMFNALSQLFEANDSATVSIALFAQLQSDLETELMNAIYNYGQTADKDVAAAAAALAERINDGIENKTLENADAKALLQEIRIMVVKLSLPAGEASDENALDYTNAIKTPGFDKDGTNSTDGWENTTGSSFGNNDTNKATLMLEYWQSTVGIYQDLVGLPEGTYEVSVQAFSRNGSNEDELAAKEAGEPVKDPAYLYAVNGAGEQSAVVLAGITDGAIDAADAEAKGYTDLGSITIDGKDYALPNGMVSTNAFFTEEGKYVNSLIVKVGADGKLRIGIKKETKKNNDWVVMDTWKLKYFGTNSGKEVTGDATGIENAVSETVAKMEIFNLSGAKMNSLQKGVNIVKVTTADGKVAVKKVVVK